MSARTREHLDMFWELLDEILNAVLFLLIGYNLFTVANEFRLSGEVTSTIRLPFYHVAYGVGVCCFLESFVFVFDIFKIWKGQYE